MGHGLRNTTVQNLFLFISADLLKKTKKALLLAGIPKSAANTVTDHEFA
jgi:hypothetical protein